MEGFVLKNRFFSSYCTLFIHHPEVGIYERKQENAFDKESNKEKKRKRKHALYQDSDQEKTITVKKKKEENTLSSKKAIKKKRKTFLFFSYFLVFFYKFSPPLGDSVDLMTPGLTSRQVASRMGGSPILGVPVVLER